MNQKQKKMFIRIFIAAVLLVGLNVVSASGWIKMALYLADYLIIGYDILRKAVLGIVNGQVFDENFLMALATVGAIILGEYIEGTAVMLFYQIGELFQSYAVGKSRRNISALMDIRPDYANIEIDGELEQVDPDDVEIGTVIVVQPGEKVPIDGVIISGNSTLNTSALTGESLPREVNIGFGREFQHEEVKIREFYYQICKILYAGGLHWCIGTCYVTPYYQSFDRKSGRLVPVDYQSAYNTCD